MQCILATDGDVSFAIILYESLERITDLPTYSIGFLDSSTSRRNVNISAAALQGENIYRIDGNESGLVINCFVAKLIFFIGGCITSTTPDDVCGLNSVATECFNGSNVTITASKCSCKGGYELINDLSCRGKSWFCCVVMIILTILDIDECDKGIHSCVGNGSCRNTQGSYQCVCNIGFTGNGLIICEG